MTKIRQFAEIIPEGPALELCDTTLRWIATPGNMKLWPDESTYYNDTISEVFWILKASVSHKTLAPWLESQTANLASQAPIVGYYLLVCVAPHDGIGLLSDSKTNILYWRQLASAILADYIRGKRPLLPAFTGFPYGLWRIVVTLRIGLPDYLQVRREFTAKVLAEADEDKDRLLTSQLILMLVHQEPRDPDGPVPEREIKFTVNDEANTQNFEMSLVLPKLAEWHREGRLHDSVVAKGLGQLVEHYRLNMPEDGH
jgi:hypothetical protein